MPRTSSESNKWTAILDDPATPIDLQNEARRHLGLVTSESVSFIGNYSPVLDSVVESLWGTQRIEGETTHPLAESVYQVLGVLLLLGGIETRAAEHARLLLSVLPRCQSLWMREHVGQALRVLLKHYTHVLDSESLTKLKLMRGNEHEEGQETNT